MRRPFCLFGHVTPHGPILACLDGVTSAQPRSPRLATRQPTKKMNVVSAPYTTDPDAFCFCTGPQKGVKAEEWIVDSGATTHMTWDKGVFVTYAAMEDMPSVRLGDGRTVKAEGRGNVCLRIRDDKQTERVINLSSVLFVPDLFCNLFSVRDITDKGNRMMFDDITCSVITRGDVVIASGHKRGCLLTPASGVAPSRLALLCGNRFGAPRLSWCALLTSIYIALC